MSTTNQLRELPFARASHPDHWEGSRAACFWCLGRVASDDSVPCSDCHWATYCSPACLAEDAESGEHRWECAAWSAAEPLDRNRLRRTDFRLTVRILSKLSEGAEEDEEALGQGFPAAAGRRSWSDLMSHSEHYEESILFASQWRNFGLLFQASHSPPDSPLLKLSRGDFLSAFGRVMTNTFEVWSHEEPWEASRNVGNALYLQTSRFDHACAPDFRRHFDGLTLVLCPLDEGLDLSAMAPEAFNDLRIAYTYNDGPLAPTAERREVLLRGFRFDCACRKCQDETEDLRDWSCVRLKCEECNAPLVPDTTGPDSIESPAASPDVCFQSRHPEVELGLVCCSCPSTGVQATIPLADYLTSMKAAIINANTHVDGEALAVFVAVLEEGLVEAEEWLDASDNAWLFLARLNLLHGYRAQLEGLGDGGEVPKDPETLLTLAKASLLCRVVLCGYQRWCPFGSERCVLLCLLGRWEAGLGRPREETAAHLRSAHGLWDHKAGPRHPMTRRIAEMLA